MSYGDRPKHMAWPRWAVDTHRVSQGLLYVYFMFCDFCYSKRELLLSLVLSRGDPQGTMVCNVWGHVWLSWVRGTLLPSDGWGRDAANPPVPGTAPHSVTLPRCRQCGTGQRDLACVNPRRPPQPRQPPREALARVLPTQGAF